jgi:cytochrome c peroxidase
MIRIGLIFWAGLLILSCSTRQPRTEAGATRATTTGLRASYAKPAAEWPAPHLDPGVAHRELAPIDALEHDESAAATREQIALGRQLFFDPRLSVSNQISCASCHDPELGWGDGRRRSYGHDRQRGKRNAPTLLNVGHWETFFWDGRAATLEGQVFFPIQDHLEMNQDLPGMEAKLNGIPAYRQAFRLHYGVDSIDRYAVARAIADFERTIRSRRSRFDRFVSGDYAALSDAEVRGLHLFRTKARCLNCHNGPLFSDQQFHNNGSHNYGRFQEDLGRYLITGDPADLGRFRTPTLRDISYTGPYFHHGNISELREVLNMYNVGMPQIIPRSVQDTAQRLPVHDPLLRPLHLTEEELADLEAFLGSISVRPRPLNPPSLPGK